MINLITCILFSSFYLDYILCVCILNLSHVCQSLFLKKKEKRKTCTIMHIHTHKHTYIYICFTIHAFTKSKSKFSIEKNACFPKIFVMWCYWIIKACRICSLLRIMFHMTYIRVLYNSFKKEKNNILVLKWHNRPLSAKKGRIWLDS